MTSAKTTRQAKTTKGAKVKSTERTGITMAPLDEAGQEASLWPTLRGTVTSAVTFWNNFLGMVSATGPLTGDQLQRWIDLARAVCWVESKHGTFDGPAGQNGKVDPMQCADTRNPWWPELTTNVSSPDRFVRGTGLSNLTATQLPVAAAAFRGFDAAAAISILSVVTDGSDDPNFTQTHSIYWGIPLLIYKTNHTYAGDPCYQCGDLSFDRLTKGAGKYNGSPNSAAYVVAIKAALALFGGLDSVTLAVEGLPNLLAFTDSPAGHGPKPQVITTRSSPNHSSRQGSTIQYLILHNTDGPLKPSLDILTQAGGQHPVSAHYVVDRGKDIYQLVSDSEVAWHAGNKLINQQSIGIEIVAWKNATGMTATQESSLLALAQFLAEAYDIPTKNILPHRRVRIGSTDCPKWIWPTDADFDNWVKNNFG